MSTKTPIRETDQICPSCGGQYPHGPYNREVEPHPTKVRAIVEPQPETSTLTLSPRPEDFSCGDCLLFEELAPALRLTIGTLRNWKYEGWLTPIHCIGRRPHFRLEQVRDELRRNGKIR
jgi:hypothetical protein